MKGGIEALGDERTDMDEVDEEAVVQAYVNIVAGACISLGKKEIIVFIRFYHCAIFLYYFAFWWCKPCAWRFLVLAFRLDVRYFFHVFK